MLVEGLAAGTEVTLGPSALSLAGTRIKLNY